MSDESKEIPPTIVVKSSRFGDLHVPADTVIDCPIGLIGFPRAKRFIMVEHKPPFCWIQSLDDPNLAFVVVDGFEFGENYRLEPPVGNDIIDLKSDDEFAILVIVTVRPDPRQTTANLKAPIIVNIRNKKGVQLIYDDLRFSTRFSLWSEEAAAPEAGSQTPGSKESSSRELGSREKPKKKPKSSESPDTK